MDRRSSRIDAWAAGFFDGEGSLTIYTLKGRKGRKTVEIRLVAQVSSQCREPLEILRKLYGGYINEISNGRVKAFWKWSLTGKQKMGKFLDAISSHSIIKKAQILTAYECLAIQRPRGYCGGRLPRQGDGFIHATNFYTSEEVAQFLKLRHRMRSLNANS